MLREQVWRRVVLAAAGCAFGVAVIVAAVVIPRVAADTSPHATPGVALLDAATAYRVHGQAMRAASVSLFICAAAQILAGLVAVTSAFLRPRPAPPGA